MGGLTVFFLVLNGSNETVSKWLRVSDGYSYCTVKIMNVMFLLCSWTDCHNLANLKTTVLQYCLVYKQPKLSTTFASSLSPPARHAYVNVEPYSGVSKYTVL